VSWWHPLRPKLVRVHIGSWEGQAEVADNPLKALLGQMFRKEPVPMLFPLSGRGSFWMPFVAFPLLLVFVKEGKVVKAVKMEPCRLPFCKIYKGEGDYALELPVWVGVKEGDRVEVEEG